jgi:cell division protein FtsA
VRYGLKNQDKNLFRVREENLYQKVSSRMKQWISELF